MKHHLNSASAGLGLLLAAALTAPAQEPAAPLPPAPPPAPEAAPAPPLPPLPEPLPGGKVIRSSEVKGTTKFDVVDVASPASADDPMSVKFRQHRPRTSSGPVTFMGVSVSSAPPELATHLPLEEGLGLVVETVTKESPAEKAGLQENDILTKLDDQLLVHPAQFSVLVARRKDGETVKLSLLRKGAVLELPVVLGKSDGQEDGTGPGTLKIGDVEIQIQGADTKPLRTFVKSLHMDGHGGTVKIEGDRVELNGEKLKILGDRIRQQGDSFRKEGERLRTKVQNEYEAANTAAKLALQQAREAATAAGEGFKDKDREEVIRQLEEALQKLKNP